VHAIKKKLTNETTGAYRKMHSAKSKNL